MRLVLLGAAWLVGSFLVVIIYYTVAKDQGKQKEETTTTYEQAQRPRQT